MAAACAVLLVNDAPCLFCPAFSPPPPPARYLSLAAVVGLFVQSSTPASCHYPLLLLLLLLRTMAMVYLLVAAGWALSSAAAAAAQNVQTTWAAVVMAFHGEREALLSTDSPFITPLGAWQAHDAGSVIRTRYIQGPGNTITDSYPISGISAQTIENSQLYIVAADTDYIAASAQAFMQGVYPPFQAVNSDADSMLANGSLIQFPLDGYQYPTIGLISPLDFNYIWYMGPDSHGAQIGLRR